MKALFVASQNPDTRAWTPVGKLTRTSDGYRFAYTKGILDFPNFTPFGRMSDVTVPYLSKELFPLFANRILAKNRPEHSEYLGWLGLSATKHDELEELSRTGGLRATDSLELIPCPAPSPDGFYEEFFFCRGLSHLPAATQSRANELVRGERLYILRDIQNGWDSDALALRTDDPVSLVGYAPAYFARDFSELLRRQGPNSAVVTVEKVSPSAPLQYRLLCRLRAPWPEGFSPCSEERFKEIAGSDISDVVSKSLNGIHVGG
ncbi:HIRAN domain-containing protein [Frateuria sp. GZRR35]|uniref:HIRAN domain-containing protein n=1 Tax=Frateuria sp. GZRR35 TaxID=3351536 RepID=UPI003EDC3EC7